MRRGQNRLVVSQEILTSESFSLHSGQCGAWSRQRSRHFRQKVCPHGVVTGSKSNLENTSEFSAKNVQVDFQIICLFYSKNSLGDSFTFWKSLISISICIFIKFLKNKSIITEIYVIFLIIKTSLCLGYKIQEG